MKELLIVGAGTFSVEVEEMAFLSGYDSVSFVDDKADNAIGTMCDIEKLRDRFDHAVVALGNNDHRELFTKELKRFGFCVPKLIHPTAFVSNDAIIEDGCIVRAHAVVSRYAHLHTGVIVNVGALIDHHCEIGEFSHILMGAVVRNCITLAPKTWVSSNKVVE